ncbi:MAG: helical backbone metal receptor [Salibacteraceae bacterium]|nr:helical backbone metal receptor [Salibacteraceae bacterium]
MSQKPSIFKDQMGREVEVSFPPFRIVSLVPSQTELLADLGLENEVVGITKFCIHPNDWFETKMRIGGTKNVNRDKLLELNPDLIIANKEENTKEDIDWLAQQFPVWISDIKTLDDALEMIESIGRLTHKSAEAKAIATPIKQSFERLNSESKRKKKVVYLIWKNPLMAAGRDTFINEMLSKAGFENSITEADSRYPELADEDLRKLNPDVVFLSSEPFPFKGKHTDELKAKFPSLKFVEVDGELFSWYGSRLLKSAKYFELLCKEERI